ncbi:hypothetical protein JCM8208_002124 [Rhodotorula glutinis]
MPTAQALCDAPAPGPPPPFPLPGERFASLAHFDLALSRAIYGHQYPLAPLKPSSTSTFTSRCPLPSSPASHAQWANLDRGTPLPPPPCTFTFVAVEGPSASSGARPVDVVLACPTHSCRPAGRAAQVRAERTQAAERLDEAARAAASVERSAQTGKEQDDEMRAEAEELEREDELERLACRAREVDEEEVWVEKYPPADAGPWPADRLAIELDELDGHHTGQGVRDHDEDGAVVEDTDYSSIEDRAVFERGAGWRWRGDGGIAYCSGPRLAGASAPGAAVMRPFRAPRRRRMSPSDEEVPELE